MIQDLIRNNYLLFGCDPELFFTTKNGKIVGAERVLPADGVLGSKNPGTETPLHAKAVVLDGVQVELNPGPSPCREVLGLSVASALRALKAHLDSKPEVKACFNTVVNVEKSEMDRLSEKSKRFGCAESFNKYDSKARVLANAEKYMKRSAGGHIHLGLSGPLLLQRERLVPILDALLGNTCVMIDRGPHAKERRKNYGRAGEYRLPTYGLEYRTLSNFWLRAYPLFHLVLGLSRMAVATLATTLQHELNQLNPKLDPSLIRFDAEKDLFNRIDLKKVRKAINENSLELAVENWQGVKEFIQAHVPYTTTFRQETGLHAVNLKEFEFFCKRVQREGLESWFPVDPLEHWCALTNTSGLGWENFLVTKIRPQMMLTTEAKRQKEHLRVGHVGDVNPSPGPAFNVISNVIST